MAKVARNKPCPCGSGIKYKKCCLEKDRNERTSIAMTTPASAGNGVGTVAHAPDPLPPYVMAKVFEKSEQFAEMRRREPARARLFWTPSRVAALETEELVARLGKLGVCASRDAYLELARNGTSAWVLSNDWRRELGNRLSRHEDDFIGLAACELWKRYCPERPSVEMLDDWMQEGYELMMSQHEAQACDRWSEVWEIIRSRLQPEMRTCDSAAAVFNGNQLIFNWVQDFALELHNAALDDSRYAQIGVRLCQDVLRQFADESELFRLNFRADLGELCYLAGRPEEGERLLLGLIQDYPDHAAGYARLADILAYGAPRKKGPLDPRRAEALLEKALARPVNDAADYDLESRLEDLRNSSNAVGGDDPPPVLP
jgi:hypothetical protein